MSDKLYTGKKVRLIEVDVYNRYFSSSPFSSMSGYFYIYDDIIKNDRIRICRYSDTVGVAGCVTGWVNIYDLIDYESIGIGSKVFVNGILTEFANGDGEKIEVKNVNMFVTNIESNDYVNNIGVSFNKDGERIGFGNKETIFKYVSINKED